MSTCKRRPRPDSEIKLLRRSGRFAAVATGLAPGERVIVYPSDRIASGVRVEVALICSGASKTCLINVEAL